MKINTLRELVNPITRLIDREGITPIPERRFREVMSTLEDNSPTHFRRVWLCYYLKWVGLTAEEVMGVIDKHNQWLNFDSGMTLYQICSVFKIKAYLPRGTRRRRARKHDLPPLSKAQQKRCQRAIDMMDREKWHDGLVIESVAMLEPDEDDDMEPTFENGCLFGYRRKG